MNLVKKKSNAEDITASMCESFSSLLEKHPRWLLRKLFEKLPKVCRAASRERGDVVKNV